MAGATSASSASLQRRFRYFTLPGADLLDVRVLADAVADMGTRIEYFGFDSGYADQNAGNVDMTGAYLLAESALRQAGSISDRAEILRDKLEDIAQPGAPSTRGWARVASLRPFPPTGT